MEHMEHILIGLGVLVSFIGGFILGARYGRKLEARLTEVEHDVRRLQSDFRKAEKAF